MKSLLCLLFAGFLLAPLAGAQSAPEEIAQVIMSSSPNKRWSTLLYIDTGKRLGYYCAVDGTKLQQRSESILERVPVANLKGITLRPEIRGQRTLWSADGGKACLLVQNRPVALLDFKNQRGYTKTPVSKPTRWKQRSFTWDARLLEAFPALTQRRK